MDLNQKRRFFLYVIACILATSISLFFRLYPVMFPTSAETDGKATMLVTSQMQISSLKQINDQYPGLPENKKQALAQQKMGQIISANPIEAQKAIYGLSQNIYKNEIKENPQLKDSSSYLIASDPYYFYGLTHDLIEGKKIMTTKKGAKYFNKKMLAPVGYWEAINLHPFIGYGVYKVVSAINPKNSAMFALSFTPLVLMFLSILIFFIICYHLDIKPWSCFLSSILFFLAPIYLRRSFFGWYDSDPYNILFPLLIMLILFLALKNRASKKKTIILSISSALSISLYAFFWQGWVYLFTILLISGFAILALHIFIFKKLQESKNIALFFSITLTGTFLSIFVFFGPKEFFFLFQEGLRALSEFFSSQLPIWPDVYLSVGELNRTSIKELLSLSGGAYFFVFSIVGIIYLMIKFLKNKDFRFLYHSIFLFIFLTTSLVLALRAQRFIMFVIIPLSILSALCFDGIFNFLKKVIVRNHTKSIKLKATSFVLIATLGIFSVLPSFKNADNWSFRLRPIFNQTWDRTLKKIKKQTPENSIINTWWSPGHFIKSVAQRSVTFDGATINVPQAYWLANSLLSSSETEALGLLRMLNTSANQSTEYLESLGFKASDAIKILKKIVKLPKQKAQISLKETLTETQISHLLSLTHTLPNPSYLFIYNDLIENIIGVSFVGRWNIEGIEKINQNQNLIKKVKGNGTSQYINSMWDLQGGLPRISEPLSEIKRDKSYIYFKNDIRIKEDTMDCEILSKKFGSGIPKSIIYVKDNKVIEKKFPKSNLSYCVILSLDSRKRLQCVLMDEFLAHSLIINLYYLDGAGLQYLDLFLDEDNLENQTKICTYEINWEKFIENLNKNED